MPIGERAEQVAQLAAQIRQAVEALHPPGGAPPCKEAVRARHAAQRAAVRARTLPALLPRLPRLLGYFAEGWEVRPERIEPELVPVDSRGETGDLFRLATLLWSVPVSQGFGRRLRYLVLDRTNGRLIGLLGLGDPVFNLRARDAWIGWDAATRRERLVHVLDAFAVGAVPPYAGLLGGKLVVSLLGCREIGEEFERRYGARPGVISGQRKGARLALVTVSSALGRSSLYNRVRLPGLVELVRLGETEGWGHFHVGEELFAQMRGLLGLLGHPYASGHGYGQGPNWRMRVIRRALREVGLGGELLRHGIAREVYALPRIPDAPAFLRGEAPEAEECCPPAGEIAAAALARWVVPRAERRPEYRRWRREDTARLLLGAEPCQGLPHHV
mgnify:CR=1 FL=1